MADPVTSEPERLEPVKPDEPTVLAEQADDWVAPVELDGAGFPVVTPDARKQHKRFHFAGEAHREPFIPLADRAVRSRASFLKSSDKLCLRDDHGESVP